MEENNMTDSKMVGEKIEIGDVVYHVDNDRLGYVISIHKKYKHIFVRMDHPIFGVVTQGWPDYLLTLISKGDFK